MKKSEVPTTNLSDKNVSNIYNIEEIKKKKKKHR